MNSGMGIKRNFKGKWALILDKRTVCELNEDSLIAKGAVCSWDRKSLLGSL